MSGILFIRHAETDMSGTFCGHSDPPVNERGLLQIKELLKKLEGESVAHVYTSDLQRATETANALAGCYATQPIAKPALREIRFGEWEGLTWKQIEERDQDYSRRWLAAYPNMCAPGGEEFEAFQRRVLNEVEQLAALAAGRSITVVTHAGVMRVVLQALCGMDEKTAWKRTENYCSSFLYSPGAGV